MANYRKIELKIFKRIGLTEKSYKIIRQQKKLQKKSMVRIVDNIIIEKYECLQ